MENIEENSKRKKRGEKFMKIGLIDADLLNNASRHPNLAILKMSGYYKSLGHDVMLLEDYDTTDNYDLVCISKVFSSTNVPEFIFNKSNIKLGGTGFYWDNAPDLPYEIEHHMPDYHIYDNYINSKIKSGAKRSYYQDYLDYSIGFSSRGCFRKCSFCVNKKYDKAQKHSPISEFLDTTRKGIYLWDDNFLACSHWEEILDNLEATKKPFQFRQGLDVRLLTDKKAQRLSKTKYHGDFIFAFDNIKDRDLIEDKLSLWRKYTDKSTKLYVLCAFESQDENDINNIFERINILAKYKCLPYIMRYEKYKDSDLEGVYTQIARWCNQPNFFKKKSFREFCEVNQKYVKTKKCAAMVALEYFENKYPEIANKWFDKKFWE